MISFRGFLENSDSGIFNRKILGIYSGTKDFEFYFQKLMEWLKARNLDQDASVSRERHWYAQRYQEISKLIKTYKGPLYRCIDVTSLNDIKWDSVGVSWAFDKYGAKCYRGKSDMGAMFMEGYIKDSSVIDVDTTILYYMVPHFSKETEIRLNKGSPIVVKCVWRRGEETIQLNKQAFA